MYKGDTICINYGGRDYFINVVDCKPNDQICVIEADINVDFDAPLDYKEPVRVPKAVQEAQRAEKMEADLMEKKREEIKRMYKRTDGKPLNKKQIESLLKEYEEARKRELEFDPRKHRLKHGIRVPKETGESRFTGKGFRLG